MYREVQNSLRTMWDDLLGGSTEQAHIPEGDFVFHAGEAPRIALIRAGVVRLFKRTRAGRQFTIRYARPGDLIGLAPLLGGARSWNAEAMSHTTVEVLTVEQLRAAVARHPELPWLIAEHIATWATAMVDNLADSSSRPMTVRVARHLRELAVPTPDGRLVADITHQRLADAVGTVREVVSRELSALRALGVIDTKAHRIEVLDEEELERIAARRSTCANSDLTPRPQGT